MGRRFFLETQEAEPPKSIDSEILKLEKETAVSSSIISDIETNSKKLARDFSGSLLRLAEDLKGSFSKWIRSMRFYFWMIFAFWSTGAIAIGYVVLQFPTGAGGTLLTIWLSTGAISLWNSKREQKYLQSNKRSLDAILSERMVSTD